MLRLLIVLSFLLAGGAMPAAADDLSLLRQGGVVALMRHATAPGTGDPHDFTLGDCTTQRNLSDEGREQARETGQRLKEAGLAFGFVGTSQWCRTRETAELLDLGPVKDMPSLNSFFSKPDRAKTQTDETITAIEGMALDRPAMLVTHQVNITALTGVIPRSGEIVVARPDGDGALKVLGKIPPP
ncbi:MAG: histidine phosphatase family protein [Phyllobacteriaceae bacterium]|nr:histidine phosphatase family protein [Phyllobacteriaceae bacterium]MBA90159.1 histidine phosphatase family protein [Phyllobacteriaceae bacterium]